MTGEKDAIARAIYERRNGHGCKPWSLLPKAHKEPYLGDAEAAQALFATILAERERLQNQVYSEQAECAAAQGRYHTVKNRAEVAERRALAAEAAARAVLEHRVGDLPTAGYLRDNNASRKALAALAQIAAPGAATEAPMTPANDNWPLAANDNGLTLERLQTLLSYDANTGWFTWRVNKGNVKAGARAGKDASNGYRRVKVDCVEYPEHRLAWFYMTGEWPKCVIDHIDRDQRNNAFDNLREANYAENQYNRTHQRNNTSGHKGVSFNKKSQKWRAEIMRNGRSHYLGQFGDIELAVAAYREAANDLHGKFARDSTGPIANDNLREAVA